MEWIFAKQIRGNSILLIFSINCQIKVDWNKKWSYYFWNGFFNFLIPILLILIRQNSKWELQSTAWW